MSNTLFKIGSKTKKDPYYLHKCYLIVILTAVTLNTLLILLGTFDSRAFLVLLPGLLFLRSPNIVSACIALAYCLGMSFYLKGDPEIILSYFLMALFFQLCANSMLHIASHNSYWTGWISRSIGEFFSFFFLVGFPEWQQIHMEHHKHSDDPEKDPHPPKGLTFIQFLLSMRNSVRKVFIRFYFKLWGDNDQSRKNIKYFALLAIGSQFLKLLFWFLVFGPIGFAVFYSTCVVIKNFSYAHFNYYTHVQHETGIKIINLKNGPLWQFINTITFGLYHHKNHHQRPYLFNPAVINTENISWNKTLKLKIRES